MKRLGKKIASLILVLLWVGFMLTAATPGFGEEPDEEKLLNQLKGELAEKDSTMGKLLDRFNFGMLIEAGAAYRSDTANGEDESDIALTTVELGIEAIINDWVTGEVVFLYEDPTFDDEDSDFDVDVGTITVGDTEQFPLYATAGKFYMPYGALLTHFPDDPLIDLPVTLTFGEINERALLVGAEFGGFNISGYAFNGSVEETGDDENMIDSFGADVNYTYENEPSEFTVMVGASYLSNLADTEGINDALPSDKVEDIVAGWAAYLSASYGMLFFEAEYMAALDDFEVGELATNNGTEGAEPAVWNIEVGFNYDWWRNLEVAFKYAGSDEAGGLEIPETRWGVALNQEIFDNTIFSVGYLNDKFEDDILDNGTEDSRYSLFSQIAIEF